MATSEKKAQCKGAPVLSSCVPARHPYDSRQRIDKNKKRVAALAKILILTSNNDNADGGKTLFFTAIRSSPKTVFHNKDT